MTPSIQKKKSDPLISVVMATHNGARYISDQIASIAAQSYRNIEIVIIDDASTDDTWNLISQLARNDSRIKCARQSSNMGVNATFGAAMASSSGDYIAISDQDDVWHPDKLAVLLKEIEANDCIYTDSILIDEEGHETGTTFLKKIGAAPPIQGHQTWALAAKNSIAGHAMLITRALSDATLPFNGTALYYDHQLALLASCGAGIKYYSQPLTMHRIHESNLMHRKLLKSKAQDSFKIKNKLERKSRRSQSISASLNFLYNHFSQRQTIEPRNELLAQKIRRLKALKHELEQSGARFFSVKLFILLWPIRKELFSRGKRAPVASCLSLARNH